MRSAEVSAPDDEPPGNEPGRKSELRTALRRLTLAIPPVYWLMGFAFARHAGCDSGLASTKATIFTISVLVGWAVTLRIWRPSLSLPPWTANGVFMAMPMPLLNLLKQTRDPWPTREMLIFGLVVSTLNGVLMGLLHRFWCTRFAEKRPTGPRAHPLSDSPT